MQTYPILIIAMDSPHRTIYSELLGSISKPCFQAHEAQTLTQAIDFLEHFDIECILLNCFHQSDDHLATLQQLQEKFDDRLPPVVILTEFHENHFIESMLANGCDDYLPAEYLNKDSLARTILHAIERKMLLYTINRQEAYLKEVQQTDRLTKLPGMTAFSIILGKQVASALRNNAHFALLRLDLDNFRSLNNNFTRDVTDDLLRELAAELKNAIRENDTIARTGSNEFTVLLDSLENYYGAGVFANRILALLRHGFKVGGKPIVLSGSIGIASFPEAGKTADDLLQSVNMALTHSKELGGDNYQFFSPEVNHKVRDYMEMRNALNSALTDRQLRLYYQPKFELANKSLCGMEALMRWQPDDTRLRFPHQFLPLAEKLGLITPMGHWVFETACQHLNTWKKRGLPLPSIAINLSREQLNHDNFVETVLQIINEYQVDPCLFEVELKESVMMHRPLAIVHALHQLKEAGLSITIDGFGRGNGSVRHLKKLPIDTIKIDRSLIAKIHNNTPDQAIVQSILALAQTLGIRVIAEGIETQRQYDVLVELGCHFGQGFFLYTPCNFQNITHYITNH